MNLFETHLAKEFGLESLLFIEDAEKWKRSFFDTTEKLRTMRAKRLFDLYIERNAIYSINVPFEITLEITNKLSRNEVDADLFSDAVLEIQKLLNIGAVKRFQHSHEFKTYDEESRSVNHHHHL